MRTTLTAQESATLISKGVSTERASEYEEGNFEDIPIYNIADLLSLLPKKIDDSYHLKIQSCDWPTWTVCYIDFQSGAKGWCQSMELIDALYKLLLWAIDHNHVKLD